MSQQSQFSQDISVGWIQWFCGIEDHFFFCQVSEDFIRNQSNLFGLKKRINKYSQALKMILRSIPPAQDQIQEPKFLEVYNQAIQLYGLIHARYIMTPQGLAIMRQRYLAGRFGNCPRVMCEKQNVIPIALSQDLKIARVKIYCPRCKDIYSPKKKSSDADGAFFGTSFPHLLLMTYPDLKPYFKRQQYVPKVFGFNFCQEKNQNSQIKNKKALEQNNMMLMNNELKQSQHIQQKPKKKKGKAR